MKDLDNGYTIREIMEMRKCSPSLVSKVIKLRKKAYETKYFLYFYDTIYRI